MAWTAPRTWVTGEVVTAALLNAHLRDNLLETPTAKVTTAGDIVYATGANAMARLAAGTTSQFLIGGASAPAWSNTLAGGLNLGTASGAGTGEHRGSAGAYLNNITAYGLIQSSCAISNGLTLQALNSVSPIGLLFVTNDYDGQGGVFIMAGGNPVTFVAGVSSTYTHTSGTGSRANVYRDGGTGKVTIQNNLGTTVTFYCLAFTNSTAGGPQ